MKRICAWCKKDMGEVDVESQHAITHGLCGDCGFHLTARMGMPMREFLENFGAPVLLVDPDGIVQSVNGQSSALLRMDLPEIKGRFLGDVFECDYAALPEGCGRTVHCAGCTIRTGLNQTIETGESCLKAPAHLDHTGSDGPHEIRFLISTEKLGDLVLLRIDSIDGRQA